MESISNHIIGSTLVRSIDKRERSSWSSIPSHDTNYLSKESILKAFRDHRLILRAISPASEVEYLLAGSGEPRPGYLIQEGTPVCMEAGELTVGILNSEALALYKVNNTHVLECGGENIKPDHPRTKCLPDLASLSEKMRELASRKWEVHQQQFTSGHLQPDGSFSLPKPRHFLELAALIQPPELLASGYKTNQLVFICLDKKGSYRNVGALLTAKRKLEQALSIPPLPVVDYSDKSGAIDIYYPEELPNAEALTAKESQLDSFCFSRNVVPTLIRTLLNLLPLDLRTKALAESPLTTSSAFAEQKQELISLLSDPEHYNPDRLTQLVANGFPVKSQLYYRSSYKTPLDLLVWTDRMRCISDMTAVEQRPEIASLRERQAIKMFRTLVTAGAWMSDRTVEAALSGFGTSIGLINLLKAMGLTSVLNHISELLAVDLWRCPGAIIEIDERCQRMSAAQLQEALGSCLAHQCQKWSRHSCTTLDPVRTRLLALFYHGAVLNDEVLQRFEMKKTDHASLVPRSYSQDRHIKWIKALWQGRHQDQDYLRWPRTVEQARKAIAAFAIPRNGQTGLSRAELLCDFDFLIRAFKTPPNLAPALNNNKTVEQILGHYYRRPSPDRIVDLFGKITLPTVWKPQHSSSHALRVRNNALWFMELLESCQLDAFTDDEKNLLALASIYPDAAAEGVSEPLKAMEAASKFFRDFRGQYPAELVDNVSVALSKINYFMQNACDPADRYVHVLHFANRLDAMRSCGVGEHFPLDSITGYSEPLNPLGAVHIYPSFEENPQFQRHLVAAMHGAADLAFVTGELKHDHRTVPFATRYQLEPDNAMLGALLGRQFEWTRFPAVKMDEFIDNNVRRVIAARASIYTCSDPRHSLCRSNQQLGVTYGIHNSGHELSQVRLPPAMTRLEKMQCGHDLSVLSRATRSSIDWEVKRLRRKGIAMSLGTLTQQTLASPAARATLRRREIELSTEYRMRGRARPGYEPMSD